jgi:hypothetical protein
MTRRTYYNNEDFVFAVPSNGVAVKCEADINTHHVCAACIDKPRTRPRPDAVPSSR